jgi:hypothetical protein
MDQQLINNAIHLLLMTSFYTRPLEEWDRPQPNGQMWVALCALIQETFQRRLNATSPRAGHHGYAPVLPFQQNAFGALADNKEEESIAESMANQVATPTHQSQLTPSTAATTTQHNEQKLAAIKATQHTTHA